MTIRIWVKDRGGGLGGRIARDAGRAEVAKEREKREG